MKEIWIIMLFAMFTLSISFAQNLVPNGSFEQYYSCPPGLNMVDSCVGWHTVINTPFDFCSPDYFDSCSIFFQNSVPGNVMGYQLPFEGHGYMGLYTYVWNGFYREVIGAHLEDTLIPGSSYHISMRVSRGNWTTQAQNQTASNKLGMRFTTNEYTNVDTPSINNYAQIYTDSILEDTVNWTLLEWDYIADSAYSFIYIGNFFDDAHTDTNNIGWNFGLAYYFIDSINVVCISSNCFAGINEMNNDSPMLFYNSNTHTIYAEGVIEYQSDFVLFDEIGHEVLRQKTNRNMQINISDLSKGFYIAVLRSAHQTVLKKIIKS